MRIQGPPPPRIPTIPPSQQPGPPLPLPLPPSPPPLHPAGPSLRSARGEGSRARARNVSLSCGGGVGGGDSVTGIGGGAGVVERPEFAALQTSASHPPAHTYTHAHTHVHARERTHAHARAHGRGVLWLSVCPSSKCAAAGKRPGPRTASGRAPPSSESFAWYSFRIWAHVGLSAYERVGTAQRNRVQPFLPVPCALPSDLECVPSPAFHLTVKGQAGLSNTDPQNCCAKLHLESIGRSARHFHSCCCRRFHHACRLLSRSDY